MMSSTNGNGATQALAQPNQSQSGHNLWRHLSRRAPKAKRCVPGKSTALPEIRRLPAQTRAGLLIFVLASLPARSRGLKKHPPPVRLEMCNAVRSFDLEFGSPTKHSTFFPAHARKKDCWCHASSFCSSDHQGRHPSQHPREQNGLTAP